MKKYKFKKTGLIKYWLLAVMYFSFSLNQLFTQSCNELNLSEVSDIPKACGEATMTMIHDTRDLDYLYVATKSDGLNIYNLTNVNAPFFVKNIPTSSFESLDVMNLVQSGDYLYLAIGNHFTNPQAGGLAVIDVSDPEEANLADYYIVENSESGAGDVWVQEDMAYLAAMKSGLVILDVEDKNSIQFVSQFMPDINFPVNNPNPDLYNVRGVQVSDEMAYLAFDAGGLRIVDCSTLSEPKELGQYANPALYQPFNLPRAYNNLVLDENFVYITVDYCGLEVLDVSQADQINLHAWWNPYNCPNNNWFTSPAHTNEIVMDKEHERLFISSGKMDLHVVDISNPAEPDSCNVFGGVENNIGTWGVGLYKSQIYLAYICTFGIPFPSNWSGIKILTQNISSSISESEINSDAINIWPNPVINELQIETELELLKIEIVDISGRSVKKMDTNENRMHTLGLDGLKRGVYFLRSYTNEQIFMDSFVKL